MLKRLVGGLSWLLVASSVAIIVGGLFGRPVLLAAVPTGSMAPALAPGDVIPVVPLWGRSPEVGAVIVFKTEQDEHWIVHRVAGGSSQQGYVTRGDANREVDPNLVFPRHIAGTVPQIRGIPARVPRLGALSLERTPLSSPIAAVLALLAGLVLLLTDIRLRARHLLWRSPWRETTRTSLRRSLPGVYATLALLLFLTTLLTTWSMASRQTGRLRVVESASVRVYERDLIIAGRSRRESVVLENPSVIPLIYALASNSQQARWELEWLLLPPRTEQEVGLILSGERPGEYMVELSQAIYLPVLPTAALGLIARVHQLLPAIATALLSAMLPLAAGLADPRVRLELRNLRLRLLL